MIYNCANQFFLSFTPVVSDASHMWVSRILTGIEYTNEIIYTSIQLCTAR